MNRIYIISLAALMLVLNSSNGFSEGGEYDWVKDHIVVRESEKVRCDADGNPTSIDIVKKSRVEIFQTFTEKQKKNKQGVLVTVSRSRVTVAEDTNLDVTTIKETDLLKGDGMQVTSIVSKKRTDTGSLYTVESRNKAGRLVLTRRVEATKGLDGVTTTTVETPDKEGNLVVRESTSSK